MTATAIQLRKAGFDLEAIDRAEFGENTKKQYRRELEKYLATGGSLANRDAIKRYAQGLHASSKSFFKAALRVITADMVDDLKANAPA